MAAKTDRSANFSEEEKFLLVSLIDKYPCLHDLKSTDYSTIQMKVNAWVAITEKFNSSSPHQKQRDIKSLKALWKRLKMKARKEIAQFRRASTKTGGGKRPKEPSDLYIQVYDLMNEDETTMVNAFDDDAEDDHR